MKNSLVRWNPTPSAMIHEKCIGTLEPNQTPSAVILKKLHGSTVTQPNEFSEKEYLTIPAQQRRFHVIEEYIANPTENDEIRT